jgi:hypothetical protein
MAFGTVLDPCVVLCCVAVSGNKHCPLQLQHCTWGSAGCTIPSGCFASASIASSSCSFSRRLRFSLLFSASFAPFLAFSFAFLEAPMNVLRRGIVYMALAMRDYLQLNPTLIQH